MAGSISIFVSNLRLDDCTEVKAVVVDDAATGGDFRYEQDILEAY